MSQSILIPKKHQRYFNRYYGKKWINARLPTEPQLWMTGPYEKSIKQDVEFSDSMACEIKAHLEDDSWIWPDQTLYFFSDLHADADAFIASLVASGGIKKTGAQDHQFHLTAAGKKARFILGGDYFDKGPSTLRLLRMIKTLIDKGADVVILAGNHDIRTLLGILSLSKKRTPTTEHFFVRMGLKPLSLFKEIFEYYYNANQNTPPKTPSIALCRKKLFPSKNWVDQFTEQAHTHLSKTALQKEIKQTYKKIVNFEHWCHENHLSLQQVYAAAEKAKTLFLHPKGEFYWFFKHLKLVSKEGSFFFVHAGVDNLGAKMIRAHGINGINKLFRKELINDQFKLYYGPLGNMIRTKYRQCDHDFTKKGALMMNNAGINAIVHGHRNLHYGQRIMLRKGIINFECDTSLDINTRKKEGVVQGLGASVTIIHPDKLVLGISSDYPFIKVFEPKLTAKLCKHK